MANRVLRDWTTSETMENLSPQAEVFFTRLIMKADDYGSFYANAMLLRSALYPLRDTSAKLIESILNECIKAGLIFRYTVDGKEYIRIKNFGQRLRDMRGKFPHPIDEPPPLADNPPPELETETKQETETKPNDAPLIAVAVWPTFQDFWDKYDKKVDRPKCEKKWKKVEQAAREKIMEHLEMYVRSTPDVQYRKNPLTYLNSESWNNEIILPNASPKDKRQSNIDSLKQSFANDVMRGPSG